MDDYGRLRVSKISVSSNEDIIAEIEILARSMKGPAMDPALRITADTNIVRDLQLDSLTTMDFILALEMKFDTIIPIDSMADIQTIGQLAELLQSQMTRTPHQT